MVFKPFANLARQGITKHLVSGGYAQSVVAASQSLPLIKAHTATPRVTNFNPSRTQSTQAGHSHDSPSSYYVPHGGQPLDDLEKDTKRYLFSKKILWSKAQHQTQELSVSASHATEAQTTVPSPVESLETVAEETTPDTEASTKATEPEKVTLEDLVNAKDVTTTISPVEQFNAELEKLKLQGRFKDITVLFDHTIQSGLQPNTETFNYLLSAIAQLIRLEVLDNRISHLLDVYSDLLRCKLTPNTKTYSILLTSLVKCARKNAATQELKEKELGRYGSITTGHSSPSALETGDADGIKIALDLFNASTYVVKNRAYSVDVYTTLIDACAQRGLTDDMFKIYAQMEASGVKPSRDTHLALMEGFGKAKDMHSVIEVYEEVKFGLENDKTSIIPEVEKDRLYKQLVMAYVISSDYTSALAFLNKVHAQRAEKSDIVIEGFVDGSVRTNQFLKALEWIGEFTKANNQYATRWTIATLAKAADTGDYEAASQAYQNLTSIMSSLQKESGLDWHPKAEDVVDSKMAFLALCVRSQRLDLARQVWAELLESNGTYQLDLTSTTLSYVKLLFDNGFSGEGLQTTANMITNVESQTGMVTIGWRNVIEFLSAHNFLTADVAGEIWKLSGYSTTGPLTAECIRPLLAACYTQPLLDMTWTQLDLAVQLNASLLLVEGRAQPLLEDVQRFQEVVSVAMRTGQPLSDFTKGSVYHVLGMISHYLRPDFLASWHEYTAVRTHQYPPVIPAPTNWPTEASASPTLVPSESSVEEVDPYRHRVDVQTSNLIESFIDKKRSLSDIARIFRRSREHPGKVLRYQTIAKIISYATRSGSQKDLCNEVFAAAKKDMPLLSEYSSVRHGWCCIYDAMIAACLNTGEHQTAANLRDEMALIGGVPSANTYGLFIVNLGQTQETFDEATEAVKLFEQSKAQNVYPTPFLYNAVIGKLAKARRVDDCLYYYGEMRALGLKPTSVTYGTMINALCRVSDERYAEELFQEMEAMPNYKPRAAPYNSMIQFFAITKRDRSKVLQYYNRMLNAGIEPTGHTYKLLIDAYASLDPPDVAAAEAVMKLMESKNVPVECTHHASLIHAKGCVLQDIEGAIDYFTKSLASRRLKPDAILYQALFEALVANHRVDDTQQYLNQMSERGVSVTPYIANTLIHGWALEKNIQKSRAIYDSLSQGSTLRREPSTYEAMTRAYLAVEDRKGAMAVVNEMLGRGYPAAVTNRILDLVRGGESTGVPIVV